MEPKTCYFPLEKLRSIQMLNVTLNSGKKPSANKIMCHAITKLFQSQSLWHAFYFQNVLWFCLPFA